jgi:4-hydroxybenzoyl-CoA thioesterase/acyl-CoA thioester hydrolase
VLQIEVQIVRLGTKSVTYAHRFVRDGQTLATGEVTAVCCRIPPDGLPQSIAIPPDVADKLRPFLA